MKKIIFLLLITIFSSFSYAQIIEAKYKVSYGKLLDLGVATTTLNTKGDNYSIKVEANTVGMAKILSNGRKEIYESFGKIVDNKFIPEKFVKTKLDKNKKRVRSYTFDYEKKKILVKTITKGKRKVVNSSSLIFEYQNYEDEWESSLEFFAQDDLLSLFFNINKNISEFKKGEEYTLKAVGANKKTGEINIHMPNKKQLPKLNKVLKTNDTKFIAYINQKIFGSARGELYISLNNSGFCTKAVLKDVLLFGDIVGEMTSFKEKEG